MTAPGADGPAEHDAHRLPYEPALDGLRAVAVVAVLLYHGQVGWSRGGFLGVDLFFVLSGYLITTLLLREHARTGTLDLGRFWARRARRLLPALTLVLLAVCAYAALLTRPSQRPALRLDLLSTIAYVANWRQALGDESYFAQYDDPSPLRHLWSLGIEEQYYLLFPLLLLGWLLLRRGSVRGLIAVLVAGAAASAATMLALYDPRLDPSRVYYGTDTRAQALLVGAASAAWCAGRAAPARRTRYLRARPVDLPIPSWGGVCAAALLTFLMLVNTAGDLAPWLYRGGFLLVAVLGAVLVVGAVRAEPGAAVVRLLGWAPVRLVGVVSYGLYLWHWPVYVVIDPARTGLAGTGLLLLRLVVTALLATTSYVLAERPVRRGAGARLVRAVAPGWLAGGAVAAMVGLTVATTAGGSVTPAAGAVPQMPRPAAPGAVKVFVIGDSVAFALWSELRPATVPALEVRGSTQLGCGLVAVPVVVDGQVEPLGPTCDEFDARWPGEVASFQPDVAVLMLGVGEQFDRQVDGSTITFGTPDYRRFLDGVLDERVAQLGGGVRRVVLLTVPCHDALETGVSQDAVVINDEQRVRWLNQVQRRYAARNADQVTLLNLHGYLCANGYVDSLDGVAPLHTDGLHLTPDGVQLVWRWLEPQLVSAARTAAGVPSAAAAGRTAVALPPAGGGPVGQRRRAGPRPAARTG